MLNFATHQWHLDQFDRYGGAPAVVECHGLRVVGRPPLEVLRIADATFYGDEVHLRRIRDVLNARLAALEVERIAREMQQQDDTSWAAAAG